MNPNKKRMYDHSNRYKHMRNTIVISSLIAISGVICLMSVFLKNMENNARIGPYCIVSIMI